MKSLFLLLALFLISFPIFAQANPADRYGERDASETNECNTYSSQLTAKTSGSTTEDNVPKDGPTTAQ